MSKNSPPYHGEGIKPKDMNEYQAKLNELKSLMGLTDSESMAKKEVLFRWIEEHSTEETNQQSLDTFIENGIKEQDKAICVLREQMTANYELLPIAYIAKNYFGKSRQWLYQRINGSKVRGHVYTLNDEQKHTFNDAVQDIAKKIGSVRLA